MYLLEYRVPISAALLVFSFASIFVLTSQTGSSFPTYLLAILTLLGCRRWTGLWLDRTFLCARGAGRLSGGFELLVGPVRCPRRFQPMEPGTGRGVLYRGCGRGVPFRLVLSETEPDHRAVRRRCRDGSAGPVLCVSPGRWPPCRSGPTRPPGAGGPDLRRSVAMHHPLGVRGAVPTPERARRAECAVSVFGSPVDRLAQCLGRRAVRLCCLLRFPANQVARHVRRDRDRTGRCGVGRTWRVAGESCERIRAAPRRQFSAGDLDRDPVPRAGPPTLVRQRRIDGRWCFRRPAT